MNGIALYKFGAPLVPAVLLAFVLAGCHSNQNENQPQPVSSGDPAAANLAPVSDTTENPPAPPADQNASGAPPPASDSYASGPYASDPAAGGQDYGDQDYGDTAEDVASDPPPALPDYDQPPCPGDDYMWTPGYWAYASDGYYWVPGEWVLAPWVGALWTPGYWGFYGGRYHWYHGYWGSHIGFYGGVDYGYGYDGDGYEGGYWRNNAFYYNTAITRVNRGDVHNVYDYRVAARNNSHVSYNGGHGGLNYRPTAAQQAAQRERHVAPLASQRDSAHNAQQNQAQFERNNHGHPQTVAETRPMNDGRKAPAPRAEDFRQAPAATAHQPARTSPEPITRLNRQPGHPVSNNHPAPTVTRPTRAPNPEQHPQPGPREQPRSNQQPNPRQPRPSQRMNPNEPRSAPPRTVAPQHELRSQPAPGATQRPPQEQRPAAPPRQETRPQPPPHPENRPAPEPHQQTQPRQQPHQENHPEQPRQPEHPQGKPNDNHPH